MPTIALGVLFEAIMVGFITSVMSLFIPNGFLFGFLLHIICEKTGINKLYCEKGVACNKNPKKKPSTNNLRSFPTESL